MTYGPNHKSKDHETHKTKTKTCEVCYDDKEEIIIVTTRCGHHFCEVCLYKSINMYYNDRFDLKDRTQLPRCPSCRTNY